MRTRTRHIGHASLAGFLAALCSGATLAGGPTLQPKAGEPLPGLTTDQLERFLIGRAVYQDDLQQEEGLGPVFNKESCGNCHSIGNIVGGPGSQRVERAGLSTKGGFDPLADMGGPLFQVGSINKDCAEINPFPEVANLFTFRVTNGMMGYGLVEAIPDAQILAIEADQAANHVDQAGDAHIVTMFELPGTRVGRFGWKAQVATVTSFTADAALNELGLTNEFLDTDNDPNGLDDPSLKECDDVADPEDNVSLGNGVDRNFLQVVTDFQRFMAAPPQTPKSGMTGETLFESIGCAVCHVSTPFTTDDGTIIPGLEPALQNQTVKLYSDLLVHSMGLNADQFPEGPVSGSQLKTPPLAGLRFRPVLWHHGDINGSGETPFERFDDRVRQAIDHHNVIGNQGQDSAAAFSELTEGDQHEVIRFLASLGRAEFDAVGDFANNLINNMDFANFGDPTTFSQCYGNGPYTADDECAVHDIDQDGDVDDVDFNMFLTALDTPVWDNDADGVSDFREILDGTQIDANDDGIADAYDACPSDTDGSLEIEVPDLVNVIMNFGPCPDGPDVCIGDVNRDGERDVQDLIQMILSWGPC